MMCTAIPTLIFNLYQVKIDESVQGLENAFKDIVYDPDRGSP